MSATNAQLQKRQDRIADKVDSNAEELSRQGAYQKSQDREIQMLRDSMDRMVEANHQTVLEFKTEQAKANQDFREVVNEAIEKAIKACNDTCDIKVKAVDEKAKKANIDLGTHKKWAYGLMSSLLIALISILAKQIFFSR